MLLILLFLCLHPLQLLLFDEGATVVGTITATDLQAVTFSITGTTLLTITPAGVLSFISPADYESQVDNPVTLPYDGSTYDVTATVIATDVSSNSAVQLVTVSIRDVGGLDDNPDTGTGTNTDTRTEGSDTDTNTTYEYWNRNREQELNWNRNQYWHIIWLINFNESW